MRGSNKIDFNALKAECSIAHQSGRKMVSVHVDELVSLLVRAEELLKVQGMLPVPVGYCRTSELHSMLQGKRFLANLRRKKNADFCVQMMASALPPGPDRTATVQINTLPESEI